MTYTDVFFGFIMQLPLLLPIALGVFFILKVAVLIINQLK